MAAFRSLRWGFLDVIVLASAVAAALVVLVPWREGAEVVRTEEEAFAWVRRLARAEADFRERRASDRNHDGIPEYGSVDDLANAGLLGPSPPVERDPEGSRLVVGDYRIEVLLPTALGPESRRFLAPAGPATDAVLAADSFAVFGRPGLDRREGLRGWYLDAKDRLWVADVVTDPDRTRPIPTPFVSFEGDVEDEVPYGPFWYREKRVEGGK